MAHTRHQSRERALGLLYEAEAKGSCVADVLAELPAPADDFVVELVEGVEANRGHLDETIDRHAVDWTIERMPSVDRNVLRMAVFEIEEHPGTPLAAVIDEAVELAKTYSTELSGRFVNGVLASIGAERRGEPAPQRGTAPGHQRNEAVRPGGATVGP